MPRIRSRVLVLFLLTISAGSGTARCLASGLEFWYSSYLLFLLVPGLRGASHPVSSSGTLLTYYFCWFRDCAVPRIWSRVLDSSYGFGWYCPVRVRSDSERYVQPNHSLTLLLLFLSSKFFWNESRHFRRSRWPSQTWQFNSSP